MTSPLPRIALGLAAALLALPAGGCGGSGSSEGASMGTGVGYVGAWYANDPANLPDSDLCVLLCENGRAFVGDRPCTDTEASDFLTYLTYTTAGNVVTLSSNSKPDVPIEITNVAGNTATFTFTTSGVSAEFTRTAASSPLCTSTTVSPR